MKMTWWRRNALALGALVILLPAAVVVIAGTEWRDYFFEREYSEPVYAGSDGIVEFAGTEWGPADVKGLIDSTGLNVPEGSKVLVGVVPVDEGILAPDETPTTCTSPILVSKKDGREWTEMRTQLGLPLMRSEPTNCTAETDGEPYQILAPFVVPKDVEGPFWLDIRVSGQKSEFVRFSIDP